MVEKTHSANHVGSNPAHTTQSAANRNNWQVAFNPMQFSMGYLLIKAMKFTPIIWSNEMLDIMTLSYSTTFNKDLSEMLKISTRAVKKKAQEMGLKKEPNFMQNNKEIIRAKIQLGMIISRNNHIDIK